MQYRNLLQKSWAFSFEHWRMWWLGVIIALFEGVVGIDLFFRINDHLREELPLDRLINWIEVANLSSVWMSLDWFRPNSFAQEWLYLGSIVGLVVLSWYLVARAESGIILRILKAGPADTNRQHILPTKVWEWGQGYARKVWGLYIVLRLFTLSILLSVIPYLVYLELGEVGKSYFGFLYFVLLAPIVVIVSVIIKYSLAGIVIKRYAVWESVRHGWEVFRKHWLVTIETMLLLFLVQFVGVYIFLIVGAVIGNVYAVYTVFAFLLFFGSWFAIFQLSVWTYLYQGLVSRKQIVSKVERVVGEQAPDLLKPVR